MGDGDQGDLSIRLRGGRLRRLRKDRGFRTQQHFAEFLGCSRSAVSTWENGAGMPRPDMLARIAAALGVPVSELIEVCGGPSLRSLRTAAGLRAVDAAWALSVLPSTYCDVETGRQAIPERWFPVLASVFGKPEPEVRELLTPPQHDAGGRSPIRRRPRKVGAPRPSVLPDRPIPS
ncbi:helix-turn-helix domain-containing protein [Streptomyces sp. NPDC008343]|uniref:helix-turn-helix domain-containing protein n=1 Tax=Streptomyces sp. NPDC008343 TaxID=3364828 RepID=UPI0036E2BCCB